jgi:hypothetical protein
MVVSDLMTHLSLNGNQLVYLPSPLKQFTSIETLLRMRKSYLQLTI